MDLDQTATKLLQDSETKAAVLYKSTRFKETEELYTAQIAELKALGDFSNRRKILAIAHNNRGHSQYMQVNFDEALEDYDDALKYDPDLAIALYNRGTIHYRLCEANNDDERIQSLQLAMSDFTKAAELQPENHDFEEGLKNCNVLFEAAKGDGNVTSKKKTCKSILKWQEIPASKLVKLLFLLDNGDKSTGMNNASIKENVEAYRRKNAEAVQQAQSAFLSFLKDEIDAYKITEVLRERVKELYDYPLFSIPGDNDAANLAVRKQDEDLLTFLEACHILGIECKKLDDKKKSVQEKLFLDEMECLGNFFIYAENLRMSRISDQLSPSLVHELFEIVKLDENLSKLLDSSFEVKLNRLEEVEGLKEALFFYIVRILETDEKLNRIYTGKLEELLEKLAKTHRSKDGKQTIESIISSLSTYPMECQPTGHCIVFCVTDDRNGAQKEMEKVKKVFGKCLGYTVKVEENPTYETVQEYRKELEKEKYRFYDSLVLWIMSHGDTKDIQLADGEHYNSKSIIDSFCKLDNFRKKPKMFFMASCQGKERIPVTNQGGYKVTVDGGARGKQDFTDIPDDVCNITAVYYEMDRLIAHATLPDKYAFRHPEEGSLYVDTVCRLMKKHRGENITQILEKVCNKIHQILFASCDKKDNPNFFDGQAKQACYYESTFQKTFNVPAGHEKE